MSNKPQRRGRSFDASSQKRIWERDGGLCVYCGAPAQVVDHVIPRSKGGRAIIANGVCACTRCNCKKKGELSQDFITRGIFWLLQQGENMDWVDAL